MIAHAHEYVYLIPQNSKGREKQLEQRIYITLVDGEFSQSERQLIQSVAHKLGYTLVEAEELIETYLRGRAKWSTDPANRNANPPIAWRDHANDIVFFSFTDR